MATATISRQRRNVDTFIRKQDEYLKKAAEKLAHGTGYDMVQELVQEARIKIWEYCTLPKYLPKPESGYAEHTDSYLKQKAKNHMRSCMTKRRAAKRQCELTFTDAYKELLLTGDDYFSLYEETA